MKNVKDIEAALKDYLHACYGDDPLGPLQMKEVRQAFLSGIHWRDSELCRPGGCEDALRSMLGIDRERN